MTYSYGNYKRDDVTAATTFEAIKAGEKTATTRYESQGNIDYWKQFKEGDIITFDDGKGNTLDVEITTPLHKLRGSGKTAKQWSKLEGWSVNYFNNYVKPKLDEAWQIEYKFIEPIDSRNNIPEAVSKRIDEYISEMESDGLDLGESTRKYLRSSRTMDEADIRIARTIEKICG